MIKRFPVVIRSSTGKQILIKRRFFGSINESVLKKRAIEKFQLLPKTHPSLLEQSAELDLPTTFDEAVSLSKNLECFKYAMIEYDGVGLAAPQVGWSKRVLCFLDLVEFFDDLEEGKYSEDELADAFESDDGEMTLAGIHRLGIEPTCLVNPQIVSRSSDNNWSWEGCLSVPGMRGWVERPSQVVVTGYEWRWDLTESLKAYDNSPEQSSSSSSFHLSHAFNRYERSLDGMKARVFQHEYDHLDGILYPSRIPNQDMFFVTQKELDTHIESDHTHWDKDYPSPGAYETPEGSFCEYE